MRKRVFFGFILLILWTGSCSRTIDTRKDEFYRETRSISYNGVQVDVVIYRPNLQELDVLIVYHGTVQFDRNIQTAANNILDRFIEILDNKTMMIVSVAYPEEGLLIGDNIAESEAALLWVKHEASRELGIQVKKIFLAGHSQGGYLVTRINTMHQTNGVIANAPGPLNLVFRCALEEEGKISRGIACSLLSNTYGPTIINPDAYYQRSLLNFTNRYKSDILFVQGMQDSPIQMYSWPTFKQQVNNCTDCQQVIFMEIADAGHAALFESHKAKQEFNQFINDR